MLQCGSSSEVVWRREDFAGDPLDAFTYDYDVFGALRSENPTSTNEFTYTGEQVDSTGLPVPAGAGITTRPWGGS